MIAYKLCYVWPAQAAFADWFQRPSSTCVQKRIDHFTYYFVLKQIGKACSCREERQRATAMQVIITFPSQNMDPDPFSRDILLLATYVLDLDSLAKHHANLSPPPSCFGIVAIDPVVWTGRIVTSLVRSVLTHNLHTLHNTLHRCSPWKWPNIPVSSKYPWSLLWGKSNAVVFGCRKGILYSEMRKEIRRTRLPVTPLASRDQRLHFDTNAYWMEIQYSIPINGRVSEVGSPAHATVSIPIEREFTWPYEWDDDRGTLPHRNFTTCQYKQHTWIYEGNAD